MGPLADLVNLRQWKKQQARKLKEEAAEQNRLASSIPGRQKRLQREQNQTALERLENKKLEKPGDKARNPSKSSGKNDPAQE